MKTVRLSALSLIVLFVVAPRSVLAQLGGTDSSSAASASETSHRLLPTDTQALLRLRERTELLRALGLSPQNPGPRRNNRLPQAQSPQESLSPQLLELLRQMAPQTLPERSPTESGTNGQQRNGARRSPGATGNITEDLRRLQKLNELLRQNNLSPSELRQLQELMQPSSNGSVNRSPTPGSSSRTSANGRRSGLPLFEQPSQQPHNRSTNGGLESLIGSESAASRSGDGRRTNSGTDVRNAADAHAERQEMLRRALGIEPKAKPSAPGRESSNSSSNQNPSPTGNDRSQQPSNGNPQSPQNALLSELGRTPDSRQQTRRPGADIDQTRRSSAASSRPDTNSGSTQRNNIGTDDARSNRLSEIARSDQPAWQKLQRIAQLARRETNQRSSASSERTDTSEDQGFSLSNGLTRKLADVVQNAAEATAGTISEFNNGREIPDDGRSRNRASQPESRSEVREWASSVNDWIARLPEENASTAEPASPATVENAAGEGPSGAAAWLIGLLIAGVVWWAFRRRFGTEDPSGNLQQSQPRLPPNASERERLIYAFHELIHQSRCGSEEWWHHARAVRQFETHRPQLAAAIQSLATIYEQARYAPDSEPSPEQLAAARVALKRCEKR